MIRAIDIHTHPPTPLEYMTEAQKKQQAAMAAHYGPRAYSAQTWDIDQFADYYARMESIAVMLVTDNETISGNPPMPMSVVALLCARLAVQEALDLLGREALTLQEQGVHAR